MHIGGATQTMTGPCGTIVVTYRVPQEGDQYVAECPEFEVSSCGDTIDDAFNMIGDAVQLYLNTLEDEGQRERVFVEREIAVFETESPPAQLSIAAGLDEYVKRQAIPVQLYAYA